MMRNLLYILFSLLALVSCRKVTPPDELTYPVLSGIKCELSASIARFSCTIEGSTSGITSCGFRLADNSGGQTDIKGKLEGNGITGTALGLLDLHNYTVRAFVSNGAAEIMSSPLNFTFNFNSIKIEDPVLKAELMKIADTDHDGVLTRTEAESVLTIDIEHQTIQSLRGIEAFCNLDSLRLSKCDLFEISLDWCPKLRTLDLSWNNIKRIDLTSIPDLEMLILDGNYGLKVQETEQLTKLKHLSIYNCYVPANFDLSHFPDLRTIQIYGFVGTDLSEDLFQCCPKLEMISFVSQRNKRINLSNLRNLIFVNVAQCYYLQEIDCRGSSSIENIYAADCPRLTSILLDESTMPTIVRN